MRIRQLKIEGFRSLKNVTWEPGDLNILIGPNGTGKSNLLRFLELITVTAKGGLGKYIQSLGGMDALIWDGRASEVSFTLDCINEGIITPNFYALNLNPILSSYSIGSEILIAKKTRELFIDRTVRKAMFKEHHDEPLEVLESPQVIKGDETLLSTVSGIPFSDVPMFRADLASIAIYHDIRVDNGAEIRRASVTRNEKLIDPNGQNLISVLHTLYTTDREFERNIDAAMRVAFSGDYEKLVFPPAADQRIQLRVRWRTLKREQSAADLSDGTLRFLFLLTVLASPEPPPVMAIDEPETGLHPAMLPIIAEYAVEAASRAQVILTTHSPQLLDAFTDKNPTTTVTKWVDGETVLQNLSGDDLAYWLKEYTLGTLFKSGELESMA